MSWSLNALKELFDICGIQQRIGVNKYSNEDEAVLNEIYH